MLDTKVGIEEKMDPTEVARQGYEAMLAGEGQLISGWKNKMMAAMSLVLPAEWGAGGRAGGAGAGGGGGGAGGRAAGAAAAGGGPARAGARGAAPGGAARPAAI